MNCNEVGFMCIISSMDANTRTNLWRQIGVFISYTSGFFLGLIWISLFDDDDNNDNGNNDNGDNDNGNNNNLAKRS